MDQEEFESRLNQILAFGVAGSSDGFMWYMANIEAIAFSSLIVEVSVTE